MASNKMEGRREDALVKQRLQAREEYERQKQTLINETEKARPSAQRFVGQNDSMEETLKNSTVGLVRLEDFQQRRKELEEQKLREAARTNELKYVTIFFFVPLEVSTPEYYRSHDMENMFRDEAKRTKKRKKVAKATLSFALDDDEEEEDSREGSSKEKDDEDGTPPTKRSRSHKNPHVDTSFLPDREREEAERKERERLRVEWLVRQEELKKEEIEVTYSFWDGSGHRKSVMVCSYNP